MCTAFACNSKSALNDGGPRKEKEPIKSILMTQIRLRSMQITQATDKNKLITIKQEKKT